MNQLDKRRIAGWTAVAVATATISFWAYWGISENFHEGWYYESLPANLGLLLAQYLSPMLVFLAITLAAIFQPRLGAALCLAAALFSAWFFHVRTNPTALLVVGALLLLGALFWYGRPQPRLYAVALAAGAPLLILVLAGVPPALRVAQRLDDGRIEARLVRGNGVSLIWAPAGPGWPRTGTDWQGAGLVCRRLSEDGLTTTAAVQDIWRLPTVDEAVRSMARNGENSGGTWDAASAQATYALRPDKESPLWAVHSPVIYWWTATAVDDERAYIIVYDGKVWPRSKNLRADYLGFRCVKEPPR